MSLIASPPVLLESGDRLSRQEFHRRYCLLPEIMKAELVDGVVYVPSPARYTQHGRPQQIVVHWLAAHALRHPGLRYAFEATVFLDANNEVQPDAFLFRDPPPLPGGARVRDDSYIEGAPQLVVEVAASSASYDLHDKLQAYERAGVVEYIVWRVYDRAIDWFRLHEGSYRRVQPGEGGIIASQAFPGLRLNVARMLARDEAGVLTELEGPRSDS
ncbi:MAG: Uma2 family endonuclease [Dehalococcoidia bacterium]